MFRPGDIVCYPGYSSGPVYGRVLLSNEEETRVVGSEWYGDPSLSGDCVVTGYCFTEKLVLAEALLVDASPKSFMSFVRKMDKEYT